jgi:hypothetical protein
MTKFIRFGEIPENEQSINHFSNENEAGVSVFEMTEDGMPALKNFQLVTSLAHRLDIPAYIVTGKVVGTGNDGEPLLNNVKIISEYTTTKDKLNDYIFETMCEKFVNRKGERDRTNTWSGDFYIEEKKCKSCGKVVNKYLDCCEEGYVKLEPYVKYVYNGVDFTNPVEGFNTVLGYGSNKEG